MQPFARARVLRHDTVLARLAIVTCIMNSEKSREGTREVPSCVDDHSARWRTEKELHP